MERNNELILLLFSTDEEITVNEKKIGVLDDYITKVAAIKSSEIATFRELDSQVNPPPEVPFNASG